MNHQGEDTSSLVESASLLRRQPSPLRRRNRLLALILAGVAMGVLAVALSTVLTIHDIEADHVFTNF